MAQGQYGLPTLYGNQYGKPQKVGFGQVLNPFRQPPQGGSVGRLPPPQSGGDNGYPPGTHQKEPPRGTGDGGMGSAVSPFAVNGGGGAGQNGMGAWYKPTPEPYITSSYSYRPRQFEGDANVDTTSAFYRQNMGAYTPSDPKLGAVWNAMPTQTQLELSSWARAGAGAYTNALLQAQMIGPNGMQIDGQYMSGDQAVEYIKNKARQYMSQLAQARQQNQPQPQATPFRVVVGGY